MTNPNSPPLVSVIIPTFNSERTIQRALQTVLAQTYGNFEIVIADDASKDRTAEKIAELSDPRIRFHPSPFATNTGPAQTRNRAIALASGTYFAFLDSDDEWLPEKLAKQVDFLEANPEVSIVVSDAQDIDPDGRVLPTEFESSPPISGSEAWRGLLKQSFIETSSVMTRAALVNELGDFDPQLFVSQDQDLWIRLALRGEVGILDQVLGKIHVTPSGHMTRNLHRQADIMLPMIERHVAAVGDRLSRRERDEILGRRYEAVGRALYLGGALRAGMKLLLKGARRSGNWSDILFFMMHASPPGIFMKNVVKKTPIYKRRSRA